MNKALLLIISSLFFSTTLQAQVYKIVDADGNVTFSQIEPTVAQDENVQVESVDISTGNSGMSNVNSSNGYDYCGDIRLPSQKAYRSSNYFSRNVKNSKENWQNSLTRLSENVERSSKHNIENNNNARVSSSYKSNVNSRHRKEIERSNQKMRDLRCAISWANNQKSTIEGLDSSHQSERMRLLDVKSKLEASIAKICGIKPIYDPSISDNNFKTKQWNSCSKSKRKDIRQIDYKLARLQ